MPAEQIPRLLARLRRTAASDLAPAGTDGELLAQFATARDETAFAALVHRHGPMVLGVCRRVLGNAADAEDACQATFLVLVRKARSVSSQSGVGGWLHGVARHTALRARRMAARRRRREQAAADRPRPATVDPELRAVIDRELDRLPHHYRAPVVLCDLEGMTRTEAARHLRCAEGTVGSRLSRARRLLAERLGRAGVSVPAGGIAFALAADAGAMPTAFFRTIVEAAAGRYTATAPVTSLTHGVIQAMNLRRYLLVASTLLALGTVGLVVRESLPAAAGQAAPPRPVAISAEPAPAGKGTGITVESVPPVVVKTSPTAGSADVDPALTQIKVTFSKDMTDESWSWSQLSDDTFPKVVGDKPIHFEKDRRTCVLAVKLQPGRTYAIWLNSEKFQNFKDTAGRPAVPYLLVFQTKKAD